MQNSNTIQLTEKSVLDIKKPTGQGNTRRETITVQYLGLEQISQGNAQAILSDGHIKERFALYKKIKEPMISKPPQVGSILKSTVINHKEQLLILADYEVIHNEEIETVGDPIFYSDFEAGAPFGVKASSTLIRGGGAKKGGSSAIDNTNGAYKSQIMSEDIKEEDFTPIKLLSANMNGWVVMARIESLGPERTFTYRSGAKQGQQGKVQNVVIFDNSGKISLTFWSEEVDKFKSLLKVGQTYVISNCQVKRAGKYNSTNHPCELSAQKTTQISECPDQKLISKYNFNVKPLDKIQSMEQGTTIDIYGIVNSMPDIQVINKRDGGTVKKVQIAIIDNTNTQVLIVGWGDECEQEFEKLNEFDIVAITNLRIRVFKEAKHLNFSFGKSNIHVNPEMEGDQTNSMIQYKNQLRQGNVGDINKISEFETSTNKNRAFHTVQFMQQDAETRVLGMGEDKVYYDIFGHVNIALTKRNMTWQRDDQSQRIFLTTVKVCDYSTSEGIWATVTNSGETIFGMTPEECFRLQEEFRAQSEGGDLDRDSNELLQKLKQSYFKPYWMKVRASRNDYGGQTKVRFTVFNAYEMNSGSDLNGRKMNSRLLNTLTSLTNQAIEEGKVSA